MQLERSEPSQPEGHILNTQIPEELTLANYPIEITTEKGNQHIATIELINDGFNKIRISNNLSGQIIDTSARGTIPVGRDTMPHGFFGENAGNISKRHFQIHVYSTNHEGSIRIGLQNLSNTNGTKYAFSREHGIEKKEKSDNINHIKTEHMIANGAEGRLEMPDGNCSGITVIGKGGKTNNEDGIIVNKDLIAVADGMGGAARGELAAYWSLVSVLQSKHAGTSLKDIPAKACKKLQEKGLPKRVGNQAGSGATIAIAKKEMRDDGTVDIDVCAVGDAKVLVISKSEKKIKYESTDQSAVQEMLDEEVLTDPIERYQHEYTNIISNCISTDGLTREPQAETLNRPVGDSIILACSDGITDFVTPEEMLFLALKYQNLCTDKILSLALRRQDQESYDIKLGGKRRTVNKNHGDNTSITKMMA